MKDRPCNSQLELFLDQYPYSKDLKPEQVTMIRDDVKRLMRFNVSKKAIDRLYHHGSIATLTGGSFYGLSSAQTYSTLYETCTIAWQYRDFEERQVQKQQGINLWRRMLDRIRS